MKASAQPSATLALDSTLPNVSTVPYLVCEAVRAYDVVSVGPQTGLGSRRVGLHLLRTNNTYGETAGNSRKLVNPNKKNKKLLVVPSLIGHICASSNFLTNIYCSGLCTHQHVPNIFVDSLEVAESDAEAGEAVAPPHGAGRDDRLPHRQGSAAVQTHGDGPLHVHTQQILQSVAILVLAGENAAVSSGRKDHSKYVSQW